MAVKVLTLAGGAGVKASASIASNTVTLAGILAGTDTPGVLDLATVKSLIEEAMNVSTPFKTFEYLATGTWTVPKTACYQFAMVGGGPLGLGSSSGGGGGAIFSCQLQVGANIALTVGDAGKIVNNVMQSAGNSVWNYNGTIVTCTGGKTSSQPAQSFGTFNISGDASILLNFIGYNGAPGYAGNQTQTTLAKGASGKLPLRGGDAGSPLTYSGTQPTYSGYPGAIGVFYN